MRSAAGWKPAGPCLARLWGGTTDLRQFCVPVAQQQSSRSITGRSKVRILPGIPISITPSGGPISRRYRLEAVQSRVRVLPGGPTGRRSGPARRDPVLTGSCRQRAAWGASPPSSAISARPHPPSALQSFFPPCRPIRQDTWLSTRRPGGRSRRGGHIFAQVAQQQRHGVESAASAGASPALSTDF